MFTFGVWKEVLPETEVVEREGGVMMEGRRAFELM